MKVEQAEGEQQVVLTLLAAAVAAVVVDHFLFVRTMHDIQREGRAGSPLPMTMLSRSPASLEQDLWIQKIAP